MSKQSLPQRDQRQLWRLPAPRLVVESTGGDHHDRSRRKGRPAAIPTEHFAGQGQLTNHIAHGAANVHSQLLVLFRETAETSTRRGRNGYDSHWNARRGNGACAAATF